MSSPGQASSRAKISSARSHGEAFPAYTEFHPRWYRPRVSTYWWLGKWAYVKFILRELSSVAVAWTVAIMLLQIRALTGGPEAYLRLEHRLSSPWMIAQPGCIRVPSAALNYLVQPGTEGNGSADWRQAAARSINFWTSVPCMDRHLRDCLRHHHLARIGNYGQPRNGTDLLDIVQRRRGHRCSLPSRPVVHLRIGNPAGMDAPSELRFALCIGAFSDHPHLPVRIVLTAAVSFRSPLSLYAVRRSSD